MIDVWGVLSHSLWIAGLAVLLATFSWAYWVAGSSGGPMRAALRAALARTAARRTSGVGMILFCAGMAATGRSWWEWLLWGALAIGWLARIVWYQEGGYS